MTRWLVFLDDCYDAAWLRLEAGAVTARGDDFASWPPEATLADDIVAIVPGTSVVIHWVELPALTPAQTQAAARLLGADVCGGTIDTTHTAIGTVGSDGKRPLALVERAMMASWLARLAATGISVERIVPLPLLVPQADDNAPAVLVVGDIGNVHGPGLAFAAEAALVEVMLCGAAVANVDHAMFDAELTAMLAGVPINLCQGEFGPSRPPLLDRRRMFRMGALALAAALLWLGADVAALLRDIRTADRIEAQATDAARAVLPRGTAIDAPRAQVAAYAARVGADGFGFSALAAPVLAALRDRPGANLQTLRYTPDGGVAAAVSVPSPADRQGIADALGAAGVSVTIGDARDDGGVSVVDIVVRPR